MSLISDVGADYFNDMCSNALFLKDGSVYRVERTSGRNSVLTFRYTEDRDAIPEELPRDFFTGWKVFEYPSLGYRRFSDNIIGYIQRRQSTRRGLRNEAMAITLSPCSNLMLDHRLGTAPNNMDKCIAAMLPRYDSFEEGLPQLLSGGKLNLVLSENVIIEPDVEGKTPSGYVVWLREHRVGLMSTKGVIKWTSDELSGLLDRFKRSETNG